MVSWRAAVFYTRNRLFTELIYSGLVTTELHASMLRVIEERRGFLLRRGRKSDEVGLKESYENVARLNINREILF